MSFYTSHVETAMQRSPVSADQPATSRKRKGCPRASSSNEEDIDETIKESTGSAAQPTEYSNEASSIGRPPYINMAGELDVLIDKWNKLYNLVFLTRERRKDCIQSPNDILHDSLLISLLDKWRADHPAWMKESLQMQWYETPQAKRRDFEEKRFHRYLSSHGGSYDLAIFWLRVGPSFHTFIVFNKIFAIDAGLPKEQRMKNAMEHVMRL